MHDRRLQMLLRNRVLILALTWLLIGAVIGVVGVERKGGGIEIVSMMIGGMIVLLIPGILLGVIGGDARGALSVHARGSWAAAWQNPAVR